MSLFKFTRICILLIILALIWKHFDSQKKSMRNWNGTHDIVIIPINADGKDLTQKTIDNLKLSDFSEISSYISKQAQNYKLSLEHSILLTLLDPIEIIPPRIPKTNATKTEIAKWSYKLRLWAYKTRPENYHSSQVRLYVMYTTPKPGTLLPHSTGLQKGLLGLINVSAYKEDQRHNNVIITHELLHIFGASDKYIISNGQPIFPDGYLQPYKKVLFPQAKAEIMAPRIPTSKTRSKPINNLRQTAIGKKTAMEINWLKRQVH